MDSGVRVRKSPPWHWIFGCGCGGCLLVVMLLGVGGYFAYQAGSRAVAELDPVGRTFIGHVYLEDMDSAWGMVSEEWKKTSNRSDFGKWTEFVRSQFSGVPQIKQEGFQFHRGTGGSLETLTYRLTQGAKAGVMTIRFVRRDGKILIASSTFSPTSVSEQ